MPQALAALLAVALAPSPQPPPPPEADVEATQSPTREDSYTSAYSRHDAHPRHEQQPPSPGDREPAYAPDAYQYHASHRLESSSPPPAFHYGGSEESPPDAPLPPLAEAPSSPPRKGARVFCARDRAVLEFAYAREPFPCRATLETLALSLPNATASKTAAKVRTWFNNRRAAERRSRDGTRARAPAAVVWRGAPAPSDVPVVEHMPVEAAPRVVGSKAPPLRLRRVGLVFGGGRLGGAGAGDDDGLEVKFLFGKRRLVAEWYVGRGSFSEDAAVTGGPYARAEVGFEAVARIAFTAGGADVTLVPAARVATFVQSADSVARFAARAQQRQYVRVAAGDFPCPALAAARAWRLVARGDEVARIRSAAEAAGDDDLLAVMSGGVESPRERGGAEAGGKEGAKEGAKEGDNEGLAPVSDMTSLVLPATPWFSPATPTSGRAYATRVPSQKQQTTPVTPYVRRELHRVFTAADDGSVLGKRGGVCGDENDRDDANRQRRRLASPAELLAGRWEGEGGKEE